MSKKLMIGLGAVGKSFLRILIEQGLFDKDDFYCIDINPAAEQEFVQLGGIAKNFELTLFGEDNYLSILSKMDEGSYVLDFGVNIKNLAVLRYCLDRNIHYLSIADASWYHDTTWHNAHQHYKEYLKLLRKPRYKKAATSIVEFGMNPGLVSCFAKRCIEEIVNEDTSEFVLKRKQLLQKYLAKGKYGIVAKILGVKYVVEIDNDNQEFEIVKDEDTIYSTWCPVGYHIEAYSAPEIIFGNKKDFYQYDEVSDCDFKDYFVALTKPGIDCKEELFSPQEQAKGFLSTHEEIYSISSLLSHKRFKPTVFFVYSPCRLASESVENRNKDSNVKYCLLERNHVISGGESVGIIVQGEKFKTRYFGNYLENDGLQETATVLQVSASTFAAYKYLLANDNKGILFPEDLPHEEILANAKKYLKAYISTECPNVHPILGNRKCF